MQHVIVAEGLSLRCLNLLHGWVCTSLPRLDKLRARLFYTGVSLGVREAQARAVRLFAHTRAFVLCVSVEAIRS